MASKSAGLSQGTSSKAGKAADGGGTPSPSVNPLTKKLNKVLDIRLDNDKELLESLKSLSTFFTENNLKTRRNLRSDIEKRTLTLSQDFLSSFSAVKQQIDSIHDDVKSMNECCSDMVDRLKASKSQTRELLEQTGRLRGEAGDLEVQEMVASAFLARFQLSQPELRTLRGTRTDALSVDFFPALEHVQQIHKDCKVLLRSNRQTAGLALMEQTALQQEQALERLYRWSQAQCRLLTADSPEVPALLPRAVAALQQRPILLHYCLDEYGTARRGAVVRAFIDALTRGGGGGNPRPIEMHSHDPLRYVGDMVAWLHQASASEAEYIQALTQQLDKTEELDGQCTKVLGHITEGVSRPLKVRVEQVLVSEHGAVTLFKLHNLLRFYHATISGLLPAGCVLLETIRELDGLSSRMFHNALSSLGGRLLERMESPGVDLTPPAVLLQMTQLVQDILQQPQTAATVSLDQRRHDLEAVLGAVLEPSVRACTLWASNLSAPDMATFLCNCLTSLRLPLALHPATDPWLERLQAQIDAHSDTLANEQAAQILGRIGLAEVYTTANTTAPGSNLSSLPGLQAGEIRAIMGRLDKYLGSPDSLTLPQVTLLTSSPVRDQVLKKASQMLVSAYTTVYSRLTAQGSGYPEPEALGVRKPEQVAQLLA